MISEWLIEKGVEGSSYYFLWGIVSGFVWRREKKITEVSLIFTNIGKSFEPKTYGKIDKSANRQTTLFYLAFLLACSPATNHNLYMWYFRSGN